MADVATILKILFLLLLPWPVWKLAIFEAYRELQAPLPFWQVIVSSNMIRGRPGKFFAGLGTYAAAVIALCLFAPNFFDALVAVAVVAVLIYLVIVRPGFGRKRDLPPGSLGLFPIGPSLEEYFYADQKRKFGPVFKTGSPPDLLQLSLRPMVCIVDLGIGMNLLKEHDHALKVIPTSPFSLQFPSGLFRNMSNKDHTRYIKNYRAAYAKLDPEFLDDVCFEHASDMLEEMKELSGATPGAGVNPRPLVHKMMSCILAEILFGIEHGSEDYDELLRLHEALDIKHLNRRSSRSKCERNIRNYEIFLHKILEKAQVSERDDKGTSILQLLAQQDSSIVRDRNIVCNLIHDFEAGCLDAGGALVWALKHLADNPGYLEKDADPACTLNRDARYDNFMKEVLRLSQSEFLLRRTTKAITVGEFVIPKGWNLRICVREAHIDDASFSCPFSFDPVRFESGKTRSSEYAPFGLFKHMCIGWRIVYATNRGLLKALEENYTMHSTADGPVQHVWLHWNPNRKFRLHIGTV